MSPNSSEPPRLSFQSFGGVAHSIVPMTNLPQFLKIKYILLFTAEMVSSFKFPKTVLRLNSAHSPPLLFLFFFFHGPCYHVIKEKHVSDRVVGNSGKLYFTKWDLLFCAVNQPYAVLDEVKIHLKSVSHAIWYVLLLYVNVFKQAHILVYREAICLQ